MNKGQLFTTDATIAATFIVFIILSTGITWTYVFQKTGEIEKQSNINTKALFASEVLIQTQGEPANWEQQSSSWFNSSNLDHLGLTKSQPNQIDPEKIKRLEEWNNTNYEEYKKLLNLDKYEFWIGLWRYNQSTNSYEDNPDYKAGKKPVNSSEIVVLRRNVEINKNWAKIRLEVWG